VEDGRSRCPTPPARVRAATAGSPAPPRALAGDFHAAAVTSFGELYTWGNSLGGALGLGDGAPNSVTEPIFVREPRELRDVRAVACGARHTLALTKLGDVFAMGLGEYGRLGQGHDRDLYTAERVRCPPGRPVELCVLPCHASRACGLSWRAHGARASASLSKPHASALPRWARMDHTRRAQVPRLIGKSVRSIAAGISHSVAF
jgi:alpha-tubulin suppressor-like RCC1 family protein